MKKTHITITVNQDLTYKLKLKGIENISKAANDLLETLCEDEKETSELRKELKELEENRAKMDSRIAVIKMKIDMEEKKISEEDKKRKQEELKETQMMVKGMIKGGLLH